MRTTFNFVAILLIGVSLGLIIRAARFNGAGGFGPGPDDVVYTNQDPATADPAEIENPNPAHPPDDQAWLSRFELIERSGQQVSSEDLLGQPYIVSFFFTTCPSICVQQNQRIQQLQERFAGQNVRFVAISVDPEHDTLEKLREYAARFGADPQQWLFLTGELDYIRRIGAEIFQQPVNQQFHTERFVLVDAAGKIEGFYNWPENAQFQKLQDKIAELLSDGESS
jgi:protein SCO1/2